MAGSSIVGALRVVLGADTAALETDLKRAKSTFGNFAADMLKNWKGLAAAISGGAVGLAIKGVIDQADKLNKLSQSIGIPVEQLSALKYAAELSDVSIEQLSTSLGKLGKNLTEAAAKPTSEVANAFRALGVATTDSNGKLRSQESVLLDIAQKFSGLKDGAGKTAVAMAIFGRAGADMIPFLNQGRDGIKEITDRAHELGIVISGETAAKAEQFNDTMKDVGAVFKGVITQAAAQILPTFQNLAKIFFETAKGSDQLKVAVEGLVFVLKSLVTAGTLVSGVFKALGSLVAGVAAAIMLVAQGEFKSAVEALKLGGQDADKAFQGMSDTVMSIWSPAMEKAATSTSTAGKALKDFNYSALGGKNAIDQFLASLAKKQAGLNAELQTIGLSTGAHERLKIIMEAEAIAKEKNIPITDALRQKIEGLATAYGNTAQRVEEAKEKFNVVKSTMEGISSKFEDALVGIIDGSKKAKEAFSDMAKGIVSDLIRMIIRMQITIPLARALTSAFGGGFGGGPSSVFGAAGSMGVPTFRAAGGPVGAGMPYIVGERGPELFVPRAAGQVISNRDAQGWGGTSVNMPITINAPGADPAQLMRVVAEVRDLRKTLPKQIVAVTHTRRTRGTVMA